MAFKVDKAMCHMQLHIHTRTHIHGRARSGYFNDARQTSCGFHFRKKTLNRELPLMFYVARGKAAVILKQCAKQVNVDAKYY